MLYRFTIRIPIQYVQQVRARYGEMGQKALLAHVKSHATQSLGLMDVKTTIQDPTNNELFTLVARVNPNARRVSDPIVTLVKTEPVEEPPNLSTIDYRLSTSLEPGLTADETSTVRYALLSEDNPRHLSGFASTFEPYFPITASLLRTKSFLLECRALKNRAYLWESNQAVARDLEQKFGQSVLTPCSGNLGKDLALYTHRYSPAWCDVAQNWTSLSQVMPQKDWFKWSEVIKSKESVESLYRQLEAWGTKSRIPMDALRLGIKRAICFFIDEPHLMFTAPATDCDRQRLSKLPPQVINIAKSLLEKKAIGVWTIDLDKYSGLFPPDPKDGFVSPSALQLVLASQKPGWSGVKRTDKIKTIFDDLNAPYNDRGVNALKARDQIERASRAIERRRWVNWYHRLRQAYA